MRHERTRDRLRCRDNPHAAGKMGSAAALLMQRAAYEINRQHARRDQAHLLRGGSELHALEQARYQIGDGDVDEARRGERERIRQEVIEILHTVIGNDAARDGGETRKTVEQQRPAAAEAAVQQHGEIAELLRYLMRGHGDGGDHAEVYVGKKGGADQDAVDEVVHGIADHHDRARGLVRGRLWRSIVGLAVMAVAMAPQHHFLQQEKHQHADQYGEGDAVRVFHAWRLDRVRQQREKGRTQLGAGGVADEVRLQSRTQLFAEQQKRGGGEHAQQAAHQAEEDDPGEKTHWVMIVYGEARSVLYLLW